MRLRHCILTALFKVSSKCEQELLLTLKNKYRRICTESAKAMTASHLATCANFLWCFICAAYTIWCLLAWSANIDSMKFLLSVLSLAQFDLINFEFSVCCTSIFSNCDGMWKTVSRGRERKTKREREWERNCRSQQLKYLNQVV